MNDMLVATIKTGTGRRAAIDGQMLAGKTGTSQNWRDAWWWQTQAIERSGASELEASVSEGLRRWNLSQTPTRPLIESLWESIDQGDDWQPLGGWLASVMTA